MQLGADINLVKTLFGNMHSSLYSSLKRSTTIESIINYIDEEASRVHCKHMTVEMGSSQFYCDVDIVSSVWKHIAVSIHYVL